MHFHIAQTSTPQSVHSHTPPLFDIRKGLFGATNRNCTTSIEQRQQAITSQYPAPVPKPLLSTLCRARHSFSAGLPPQCLIKLQFRDQIGIRTRWVRLSQLGSVKRLITATPSRRLDRADVKTRSRPSGSNLGRQNRVANTTIGNPTSEKIL